MKLELDGLTKEFGDFTAVNHINLTMTNGVYGLLGVNGAGKTTLMRMLCTLLKPTSGTICCNGKDIFSMDSEYRKLLAKVSWWRIEETGGESCLGSGRYFGKEKYLLAKNVSDRRGKREECESEIRKENRGSYCVCLWPGIL